MKRIITITLAGNLFHLDEDAGMKLKIYLNYVERNLAASGNANESMKFIEKQLSDIFTERLSKNKEVINVTDVNYAINLLGTIDSRYQAHNTSDKWWRNSFNYNPYRRFYRSEENKIVGGVCEGLGIYFRVDPVFIRLLFLFFLVPGIFIYLIICLLVPLAITPEQKLQMNGC